MEVSKSDRLSELPEQLIFNIFSHLPIVDVVRTTILSQRWKDLWKTSCFLYLDNSTMKYINDQTAVPDFVDRALGSWSGIKILKLKIDFNYLHTIGSFREIINTSLEFAVEKSVAELEVLLHQSNKAEIFNHMEEYYLVPEHLYSCSSLEILSLEDCSLRIHENNNVKWDRLRSLSFHGDLARIDKHVISQILLGSPKLEEFVLSVTDNGSGFTEKLCIQSTSLKSLSIVGLWPVSNNELEIQTPNLETLKILGLKSETSKKLGLYAPSLTDVTLGFWFYHFEEVVATNIEETLRQILPTTRYVESVALSTDWWKLALGSVIKTCLDSSSSLMVKYLEKDQFLEKDMFGFTFSHVKVVADQCRLLKIRLNSRSS